MVFVMLSLTRPYFTTRSSVLVRIDFMRIRLRLD